VILLPFILKTNRDKKVCTLEIKKNNKRYQQSGTRYYRQVGGLCYACNTLRVQCDVPISFGSISNNPCSSLQYNCAPYCPVWQIANNPTWTAAQAYNQCLLDYANYTGKFNPYIQFGPGYVSTIPMTDVIACSGHKPDTKIVQIPSPPSVSAVCDWPPVTTTEGFIFFCSPQMRPFLKT